MATSKERHSTKGVSSAHHRAHEDEDDEVSIGSLMKKGKKSHAAKLEDRLRQAHAVQSSPPVTVQSALDVIESALGTLKIKLEGNTSSSVRKYLVKMEEGLRGLQSKTKKGKKSAVSKAEQATTTTNDPPKTSKVMKPPPPSSSSLPAVAVEHPSTTIATPAPSQPATTHIAFEDDYVQDLSSIPLDSSLPPGVSLQLAFTPDGFCDGIKWPVVVFNSIDIAKAWGMDVTMLQLLHPGFDSSTDRVLFYFARFNTMQDLNQLAVLPLDEAAAVPWTLDACAVSCEGLYQLAMQQAARFAAALCPLHAMEWLAHCANASTSFEFSTPDELAAITADLQAKVSHYTESQLLLYASWPILQDSEGWSIEPSPSGSYLTYVSSDGARFPSRLAALRFALAAPLDAIHQIVWTYLRHAQLGRQLAGTTVESLGRQYDSVQAAVQAYFGGLPASSPRGAIAAAAAAASDVSEIQLPPSPEHTHSSNGAMDRILAALMSAEYGWFERSDSIGHMYCQPTYSTAAVPVLGTDFFRSATDVELYLTSSQRDMWERLNAATATTHHVVKTETAAATSKQMKRPSPSPKAKKHKPSKRLKKSPFQPTFADVYAYLETKGWFHRQNLEAGHSYYYKPHTDVATAEHGKTMFASADELETYLKASSVWYRVTELLEKEHDTMALLDAADHAAPKPAPKPKPPAAKPKPPKKGTRVSSRSMVVAAAAPEFKPTFSKVYSELQKEGWFHRNGQFGWSYYKPGTNVKQAQLDDDMFSNEVHLEQYLKSSGEWQRVIDQKNQQLQELYGYYPPLPSVDSGAAPPPPPPSSTV
ncbi:hypothetical protein DYB37_007229 [Aphanomyces astaci]|uniref:Uncharacterized protein n=1 Tax=Aphanomyces astaci TaxID=112090 RepID=A0A418FA33_APHAT|nr:hypothetical protein DYB37_007229 [Aphanomyces astaci]